MSNNDYIPIKPIWLVFDLCNGHPESHQYVWWFRTRKQAREHIAHVKSFETHVNLSKPQKWWSDKAVQKLWDDEQNNTFTPWSCIGSMRIL